MQALTTLSAGKEVEQREHHSQLMGKPHSAAAVGDGLAHKSLQQLHSCLLRLASNQDAR